MILLKIWQNATIYLNILLCKLQQSLKKIHFYITGKMKFPFTKYFPGTRVNPIVNKCLNG